jgi:hypothetical protein
MREALFLLIGEGTSEIQEDDNQPRPGEGAQAAALSRSSFAQPTSGLKMTRPQSRGLRPGTGIADLVAAAREQQVGVVSWLISLVESKSPFLRAVAAELTPYAGRAQVVGLCRGPTGGRA